MAYDFDRLVNRNGISVKYDMAGLLWPGMKLAENVIPMWIADMDFACCDHILDALKERLTRPTLGYENPVTPDYLETIVRWMEERHGYKIGAEEIITCTGAIDALKIAILAFTKPGDGILIQQPVYGPFSAAIQTSGRKVVNNRLLYESGVYQIDFDDLEEKASDPHTTMLAFCNPHNPVGRVWSVEELHRIYDICRRHDVYIVSDEVHGDIVRAACTYTPMGRIGTEKVIMTTTPGKAFNVSGLHLAHVLIGSPVTREAFVRERGRSFPSPFAAAAAKAAYSEGGTWLQELNQYLDQSFEILKEELPRILPKAKLAEPEGMFLAWIDLNEYHLSSEETGHLFVEKAGVIPDPGTHFGVEGTGFVRLNIACPHSMLREALRRIGQAFAAFE